MRWKNHLRYFHKENEFSLLLTNFLYFLRSMSQFLISQSHQSQIFPTSQEFDFECFSLGAKVIWISKSSTFFIRSQRTFKVFTTQRHLSSKSSKQVWYKTSHLKKMYFKAKHSIGCKSFPQIMARRANQVVSSKLSCIAMQNKSVASQSISCALNHQLLTNCDAQH